MQQTPIALSAGVELGSPTVRMSVRSPGQDPEIRYLDGEGELESVLARVRNAAPDAAATVFAVPASWGQARREDLVDTAARMGFADADAVAAPEACAVYYAAAPGREFETDQAILVGDLGARSFDTAVVRRGEDAYATLAAASTAEVGGREFDLLLLAYLSGRYRDTDPEFWDRVDAPGLNERVVREALLEEIRAARELISRRSKAGVPLPVGERDLHLTREEVEGCISELIDTAAEAAAATVAESGVEPVGLLLVGGASQTPLLAAKLAAATGLEPVVPARPETAAAEGAGLLALARVPEPGTGARPRRHTGRRVGVLAAVMVPLLAAGAVFGTELATGEPPESAATDAEAPAPTATGSPEGTTPEETGGSGGSGGQEPPGSPQAAPTSETAESGGPADPTDPVEETATAGSVPEVTGMSANEAEQTLNEAGYTNVAREGDEEGLFGDWYENCEVIEQDPASGEDRPFADTITITFSHDRGTDPEDCA